jgi:hypothetical protein
MKLTDSQLREYDRLILRIDQEKRKAYLDQVDRLTAQLAEGVKGTPGLKVRAFRKAGSLKKGTALRPRDGLRVDADVAVYLDTDEQFDLDTLHEQLRGVVRAAYPTKADADFTINPKTLGVSFVASGLDVDLVPVLPDDRRGEGWGWQPSSDGGASVLTCIPGQLDFIRARKIADHRYRSVVRLAKRWRDYQELSLRSFPIELWLAYLQGAEGPCMSIEAGLYRFFVWLSRDQLKGPVTFAEHGPVAQLPVDPVVTLDPVNFQNNVTARLTDQDREAIVDAGERAADTLGYARRVSGSGQTDELWRELVGRNFKTSE